MRILGKILGIAGIAGIVLLVLAVAATTFAVWTVRRSFPQTSGEISLAGLGAPVQVLRDERGIPQLYADDPADLFFAQGYVHAQDRFFEMDFRRHITAGRLSEMFGDGQVETDTFLRTLGWRRVAEQELALLDPGTVANLEAYARGVNAYLADHSGARASLEYAVLALQNPSYSIEPWTPVDSVAWLKAMAWDLRGNMEDEIERALVAAQVGLQRTAQLFPPYPYERHRPIVDTGNVVDGVFDQHAGAGQAAAASPLPVLPAGSTDALARAAAALASLDPVLGPGGNGIGSNSWVVSGSETDTGKPLLANDPHLSAMMPSIWYQMGLHCRSVSSACPYDVAGFTFSGLPGVVIGHNGQIAWGFTNLGPDVTDLYLEKVEAESYVVGDERRPIQSRTEVIKVAGGDDVTITVRSTEHGPILSDASEELADVGQAAPAPLTAPTRGDGYAVALRWTALSPGRTMDAVDKLNTASDWDGFRAAAALFEVPSQNLIFASVDGRIGYQAPGQIPIRRGYTGRFPAYGWDPAQTWTGFIPFDALPNVQDPDDGWIVTANQAAIHPGYAYFLTDDWSYGARSQRIVDLITQATAGAETLSADEIRSIQFDAWNENAAFLVPRMTGAQVDDATAAAMELWKGWDFTQPADSAAAAYFNVFWKNLLQRTFDTQLPTDYRADGGDRWFTVVRNLWDRPDDPWWDDATTAKVETRDEAVGAALDAATAELSGLQGSDPQGWRWGALHTLLVRNQSLGDSGISLIERIFNRGPIETSGGDSIVNATGWTAYDGYEVDWVPSMRMVVDLADLDRSSWVNLTGSSGHAYHRNYVDQLDAWAAGNTFPFPFTQAAVDAATTQTLTLTPS